MTYKLLCYDPRAPMQARHQQTTWKATDNPALISAHLQPDWLKDVPGFWEQVAKNADYCDEPVPLGAK